jgi:hypothetical protein
MEKGLLVSVLALPREEEGDFEDYPGTLEFIDQRVYLNVLDTKQNLDISLGFNLKELLAAMREAFFDQGAD